jgi:nickel-dependent lactate racemase
MARIHFRFGGELLPIDIPDAQIGQILTPQSVKHQVDLKQRLLRSLMNPIAARPLSELVFPGRRAAVIIDDISRPTPTHLMLPLLLAQLHDAGLANDDIQIVIALGTHRRMSEDEIIQKTGSEVADRYEIINVPCWDKPRFVYVGSSSSGIPAWVNKDVAEADIRIGVGMIAPHMDVGFSGGGKIILPGVCGKVTVEAFHLGQARLFDNQLGIQDAPMRMDLEKFVGERLGVDFIFNVILDQDNRVVDAVAGHYIKAHRRGVEGAKKIYGIPLKRRYSIVISNAFPTDIDLWQSTKGLASGELMTDDGGTLILLTRCPEGNSAHPLFADYIGQRPEQLLAKLDRGEAEDPVACALAVPISRIRQRVRVALVSPGLDRQIAFRMGCSHYASIEDALSDALHKQKDQKIGILTHGGTSLPLR